MGRCEKILEQVILGRADTNIEFSDLCRLLLALGFEERIRGSHHIFSKMGIAEILNLQPLGAKTKAYQVRQIRSIIAKYKLGVGDE